MNPPLIGSTDPPRERDDMRPKRVLFMLSAIYTLVYMDRGGFSSNSINGKARSEEDPDGSGFQGEFDLTNFQDGLLPSFFLVGILIGAPIFSQAIRYYNPLRLVGYGIVLWTVSVALCGLTINFATMAICRMFVGFGEAAVLAFGHGATGPWSVDDKAPKEHVTLWIALLYVAIPLGMSLGYLFGSLTGMLFGWRGAFFTEALLMVPCLVFCFRAPPISMNSGNAPLPEGGKPQWRIFLDDAKTIMSHKVFDIIMVGNTLHVGSLGAVSYWAAKAAKAMFHQPATDVWIGMTVLISGLIGMLAGGRLLDRLGTKIPTALRLGFWADLIGAFIMALIFLFVQNFYLFVPPFIVCFIFVFVETAPVTAASLWSVPLHLRPLASSLLSISIHVFGDMPSPAIFGALLDALSLHVSEAQGYRICIALAALFLFFASLAFCVASIVGRHAKDYRVISPDAAEEAADAMCVEVAQIAPLLPYKTPGSAVLET